MNRTGLLIALAIAAVAGVVFGVYPDLDLRIARYFYSFEDANHNMFALRFIRRFCGRAISVCGSARCW